VHSTTVAAAAAASAAAVAVASAAAVALAPADVPGGLGSRDLLIKLLVSKLQWSRDVRAVRVHVHVPRVHDSKLLDGALPFTSAAAAAAVALTPAAAAAVAVAAADDDDNDDDDDDDDWRRRAHAAGQRLPVGRYTKSLDRCWSLQRRNRLRLELDWAHHRRCG